MILKKHKIRIGRVIGIASAVLILILTVMLIFLYNKYINNEKNLVLLEDGSDAQKIYILGTVHEYHFYSILGYSYQEIQNIIDNVKPDLLLLEVEQEAFEQYDVIKSPIEMIPLWCYAEEQGIEVRGVDWFEVSENSRSWTTDKQRDDHIFENIMSTIEDEPTILIILGATHRIEQVKRFESAGYKQQAIKDKAHLFKSDENIIFQYPSNTVAEIEKQIEYWNTVATAQAISVTSENSKGRSYWLERYEKLTDSLQEMADTIFTPNLLFR